ncbi:MAG: energy-coupling factor transporter transmembrane component T [Eubacterium sp.]
MDAFSKLNPKVTLLFFACVMILSLSLFNPIFLAAGFLCSFFYNVKLRDREAVCSFFKFILPLTAFVAVFNMIFSSYGETVLFSIASRNFTLESLFCGLCQGMMFSCIIMWFSAYSIVVTSDKFLAVFGRLAPNSALVFSMVLSFVPRLKKNIREIDDARNLLCKDESKLKKSISNFSALVTMTLEESIEISDSMKSRNFTSKRTVYSKYSFRASDGVLLFLLLILFVGLIIFKATGKTEFIFEPVVSLGSFSYIAFALYCVISLLPLIVDLSEDVKWYYLKQKI